MDHNFSPLSVHGAANEPCYFFPSAGPSQRASGRAQPDADDWTTVTDRRAKKKIQNRVAQRTYRKSDIHLLGIVGVGSCSAHFNDMKVAE